MGSILVQPVQHPSSRHRRSTSTLLCSSRISILFRAQMCLRATHLSGQRATLVRCWPGGAHFVASVRSTDCLGNLLFWLRLLRFCCSDGDGLTGTSWLKAVGPQERKARSATQSIRALGVTCNIHRDSTAFLPTKAKWSKHSNPVKNYPRYAAEKTT